MTDPRKHAHAWIVRRLSWRAIAPGTYLLADLHREYLHAADNTTRRPAGPRQFDAALRGVFGEDTRRRTNRGVAYTLDADRLELVGAIARMRA